MSLLIEFSQPPGKPILRGFDFFWVVIRRLGALGPFTVRDILLQTNRTDRSTVADFVSRLVAGGIVEETGETVQHGRQFAPTFKLLSAPVRTPELREDGSPVLQGRGQAQMWTVMRGPLARTGFTYQDLVLYGSTDAVPIKDATAKAYIKHLDAAGYLLCVQQGRPRHPAHWRLKADRNTGPQAPAILRSQFVFDPNRREAFAPIVAEEVAL